MRFETHFEKQKVKMVSLTVHFLFSLIEHVYFYRIDITKTFHV